MSHAQRRPRTNHFDDTAGSVPHPPIVSREQWLVERRKLLGHEKDLTQHYDRVNAERRRLPMVKIEKDYVFDDPNGKQNLKTLFQGSGNSSSITSCSIRRGKKAAQAVLAT